MSKFDPCFFLPELGGDFVFDEVAVEIPLMVREDQTRDLGTCTVRAKLFEILKFRTIPVNFLFVLLLIVFGLMLF